MQDRQQTIAQSCSISGSGLHTGVATTLTFHPAPENHGIVFWRSDLGEDAKIPADADLVVDVSRGTTLEQNGTRVQTVEHVLAALVGLRIDNVLLELNAVEMPIMDGSSLPFVEILESAGILPQAQNREYLEIKEDIRFYDKAKDVEMMVIPHDNYRITAMIDYKSPVLGSQHAVLNHIENFKTEVAASRTFCFLHELEMLLENGLIKGGDLNNAIVVVDRAIEEEELARLATLFQKEKVSVAKEGILNNVELRFINEPARHKLLDMVGDLALVGMPIKGHILASKPGHAANVEFAKLLKKYAKKQKSSTSYIHYHPNQKPKFDILEILETLPHRYPFVMVDKIMEMSDTHVVGIKNVTFNENYFMGHFPANPVMPGVLQIEAMAQVGGILCLHAMDGKPSDYWTYFLKIENCKFKDKVIPGDTLTLRLELTAPIRRGICQMKGVAMVGERIVSEAELMAQLVKKQP
jgi:UDP-3-O-[3-hydroxymyristoyl] N-acetylglucosamine deacetylase/3-hydroxyacyl-[acyl-carrier-protein] dehydratase